MPTLPSSVLEPLWVQFAVLLPTRQVHHPLGCHRRRIDDRVVFDKLIQVLVFGCGYRRIADQACSATTLRRRRDEWITLGLAERLRLAVLGAYDRLFGLELEHLAADGCTTKAPCGGQTAGPSPVDRRKQGRKRSTVTEAGGIPLGTVAAPANRRDDGLLAATLDAIAVAGPLPTQPVIHLDAGYDYQPCRQALAARGMVGEVATRGIRRRSRRADAGRSSEPTPGATSTASCAGAPNVASWWWRSGWRWPTPPSSVAGWSAGPGPATAGRVAHADAHDRLLAQALIHGTDPGWWVTVPAHGRTDLIRVGSGVVATPTVRSLLAVEMPCDQASLAAATRNGSNWQQTPEAVLDAEGTHMENLRTDRLSLLVDQLARAREIAQVRLTGLGDEEYLWEPAPGAWSIRRRGHAASPRPYGPGEWVLDRGASDIPAAEYVEIDRQVRGGMTVAKVAEDWGVSTQRVEEILNRVGPPEPDLVPVTTIAWRLGHLHVDFAGRWEWTFGERRRQPDLLVDFTPSAALAVERFWALMDRWHESVAAMTPEQLDTPGFGQYPNGSDPDEPFAIVLWGANLEFIHHMAEIALLRDLWRARSASEG